MKKLISIFLALFVVGCASNIDPMIEQKAKEPLYCDGAEQCSLYWKRAEYWVSTNSRWKLETVTDVTIRTANPLANDPYLAFQVSKKPITSDKYQILIAAYCDNMFGCVPNKYGAMAAFKQYVKTGMDN
ncbi:MULTISPECIES: hypothetical protein [unclassified Gilliamella]|uniref:hypothetical protein n=1 Tax=unclassified Gilliamella TaxID=2685620 RepID=UPI00226A9938|nr:MULTISPECIES: hypothetical protein [unclassified Gilliamella]MCX8642510.1 hypothetical protein [Gilliamella sp. B3835]MCX8706360.1 hypothetical protein [Gilliamella sp. B3783]MCX8709740.1 hypothetical protein [Gilliamella sp. B3780]MCX8714411.1 hypothetical protein [Gilliamella sp. B3781]MCX8717092.1 hypothetical protein [Gilliamella sp. B3784]